MRIWMAILVLAMAAPAAAQMTAYGTTRNNTTLAFGAYSGARTMTGSISGERYGTARAYGSTSNTIAFAGGLGNRARVLVGSVIGPGGSASAFGSARNASALTLGFGGSTCVAIGSVGPGGRVGRGTGGSVRAYDFGFLRRTRVIKGSPGLVCN